MSTKPNNKVIPRKKDLFVKHSYALVNSAYVLEKTEKKLVAMGLLEIMNTSMIPVRGAYPVDIKYTQYRKFFGSSDNLARDIKTATRRLQQKLVTFYHKKQDSEDVDLEAIELVDGADEDSTTEFNWASRADHHPRKGYSTIYFNQDLFDMILQEGGHAQILLTHIAQIENKYTYRLYDSILAWVGVRAKRGLSHITFSVQWMADRYVIPPSYMSRRAFFENKFLKPCVDDINRVSGLQLEYEFNIKEGGWKDSTVTFSWDIQAVVQKEYDFKRLPKLDDFNDESEFLEVSLVYIETFTDGMEKPDMLWGMKLAEIHQKLTLEPLSPEVLQKVVQIS